MKKFFSLILVFCLCLSFAVPVFAASGTVCPYCGSASVKEYHLVLGPASGSGYECENCGRRYMASKFGGYTFFENTTGPLLPYSKLPDSTQFYTQDSGSAPAVSDSGADRSHVYTSSVSSVNSGNTINTENKTWYNPVTNTYNTYNNITYNNEYNSYNITNNTYNAYVTNNYTYISYYIYNTETNETDYYEVYYELPDGHSSYTLKPEDVWGQYLNYDVYNYQKVLEDDGVTKGLWHLDGDLIDSSAFAGVYNLKPYVINYADVDDVWGSALSFSVGLPTSFGSALSVLSLDPAEDLGNSTFEFRIYYPLDSSSKDLYLVCGASKESFALAPNVWNWVAYVNHGGTTDLYVNGSLVKANISGTAYSYGVYLRSFSPVQSTKELKVSIDEVRLSSSCLYSGSSYVVRSQPFDTNSVLVEPEQGNDGDIAIKSSIPVSGIPRIGGVRPTYPVKGNTWVYLENSIVQAVQQFNGAEWVEVPASVFLDGSWVDCKGFDFETFQIIEPTIVGPSPSPSASPTPGPGEPTPTPVPGGGVDDPGGAATGLGDLLASIIGGITSTLAAVIGGLIEVLTQLISFCSNFGSFLGAAFVFVPPEIITILTAGMTLMVILGVIKFLRG